MNAGKRSLRRRRARSLIGFAVLAGVLSMLFPLPMFRPSSSGDTKDRSEAFPCQDRPCGCQSAAQCWKKCCCFTNAQKIAWAKSHGVTVPEYVRAAARKESESSAELCSAPSSEVVVRQSEVKDRSCCQSKKKATPKSCCQNRSLITVLKSSEQRTAKIICQSETQSPASATQTTAVRKAGWMLGLFAAECHGQGFYGFAVAPALIPDTPSVETTLQIAADSCIPASERLPSVTLGPPLPPPKIS